MAIQFGIATMTFGGVTIGHLQNVSIDISFEVAKLYSGGALFPVDTRPHTGSISGTAEFAELNAETFEKLLGGTRTGDTIALANTDSPQTFQLVASVSTDGVGLTLTFLKVRSTKLSMPFARENHQISNFDFECESTAAGQVATIDLGDIS